MVTKTYVALLRGINVGGNNKVEMRELRQMFEKIGFSDVLTYINSGNVIFAADKKPAVGLIEKQIEKTFGFSVRTLIRSAAEIKKVATTIPRQWTNDKERKTDVLFLWDGYNSKESLKLVKTNQAVDKLMYVQDAGVIVWHLSKKDYGKSSMNDFIGTELYKNMTARNVNTVRKLAGLLEK